MVMRADVALAAIDAVPAAGRPLIYLSPRGLPLTQARVGELAAGPGAILLCGRFEGLDQRAIDARRIEEISIGDSVLAGGGDRGHGAGRGRGPPPPRRARRRRLPGRGKLRHGLLEYPHYTRPQTVEGHPIPEC
ncbi:MAG: hypothetical protein WDN08_19325 [Rhizomicrobium sp.]